MGVSPIRLIILAVEIVSPIPWIAKLVAVIILLDSKITLGSKWNLWNTPFTWWRIAEPGTLKTNGSCSNSFRSNSCGSSINFQLDNKEKLVKLRYNTFPHHYQQYLGLNQLLQEFVQCSNQYFHLASSFHFP